MDTKETIVNDNKISALSGLLFDCPLGKVAHNCPFQSMWQLTIDERFELVDKLTSMQIFGLIAHHKLCLKKRDIPKSRLGYNTNETFKHVIAL